ncbi:MAG TPA: GntR family transcriptional regulator [Steroidobacteraceae bacterium]|nr:GntR family transcriptional regulator [Steroidobacteraceae bacterium]
MSVRFEQIDIEPAYRKVAAALRARILDQSLREGDRLPAELELARQFGVNRSTVREALRELQTRGLLARRRGSKCFAVTRPAPRMVAEGVSHALALHGVSYFDVWEGLSILEPPIAEAAARRRSAADLREIEAAAQRYAADHVLTERAVHHAVEFFRVVGAATHNRVLLLAQAPLLQLLEPSLCAMIDRLPQARTRIRTAQRRICEALHAGDAVEAGAWMARHIRDFRRGYELAGIALESACAGRLEASSVSATRLP